MNKDAFKKRGLSDTDMVEDYKKGLSLNDLTEKYQVSKKTIQRRLIKYNVEMRPTGKPLDLERRSPTYHYGKMAQWLRENPDVKLPRSIKKISEMTGLPYNIIHTYIKHRKVASKRFQSQIDITKWNKPYLLATDGKLIPIQGIKSYKVDVDFVKQIVTLDCLLKINIRKKIMFPLKEIKSLIRKNK